MSAKGLFPDAPREQVCCECELLSNPRQKWERAIESRKLVPEDDAVEIWNQAMLEVDKGWLSGPTLANVFDWSSTVPNVRFALKQGDKVRCCDDLKRSGVNASAAPLSKIDLPSVLALAEVSQRMLGEARLVGSSSVSY